MAGGPAEALTSLWKWDVTKTIIIIASECSGPVGWGSEGSLLYQVSLVKDATWKTAKTSLEKGRQSPIGHLKEPNIGPLQWR